MFIMTGNSYELFGKKLMIKNVLEYLILNLKLLIELLENKFLKAILLKKLLLDFKIDLVQII